METWGSRGHESRPITDETSWNKARFAAPVGRHVEFRHGLNFAAKPPFSWQELDPQPC